MNKAHNLGLKLGKMDDALLNNWAELLEDRVGTYIPRERRSFLETSIALRMKEINRHNFADYFHFVRWEKEGQQEWLILVDRLTIHETRFFRHKPSLNLLEKLILPELYAQGRYNLKIWSAGCSTGEEVYTIAMIVDKFLHSKKNRYSTHYPISITGMDISLPSLKIAKEAVYKNSNMRYINEQYLKKYFIHQNDESFKIIDTLKKHVHFMPFNIIDMKDIIMQSMDIIFCQNVLIYFTKNKRKKIIQNLVDHLKPGGYLVLGAGEMLNIPHIDLEKVTYLNTLAFHRKK